MTKLKGRLAIVTGGGRGLGQAFSLRLAALGATVAVCDSDLASYREFEADRARIGNRSTVDEILRTGGTAQGYELDVQSPGAVEDVFRTIHGNFGSIDILVCNAGGGRGRPLDTEASSTPLDLWHDVMNLNLFGTVHCANAVAPYMKAQKRGKIVTVSSSVGLIPSPDGTYAHYGTSKAAIAHFTKFLARDLGPFGITANCMAPGTITTGRIMESVIPNSARAGTDLNERVGLRRLGSPEDCAGVLEFLATDLSDYVNGVVVPVDGGLVR